MSKIRMTIKNPARKVVGKIRAMSQAAALKRKLKEKGVKFKIPKNKRKTRGNKFA